MSRWLFVLAIGCGAKPQPCAEVADHAKSLLALHGSAYEPDPREALRGAIEQRCERDDWPADARACIGAAASVEAFGACRDKLSVQQALALGQDIATLPISAVAYAKRPPSSPSDAAPSLSFVIVVRGEHDLEVAGHAIGDDELDRALHAVAAKDPSTQVVIRAARGVPHGVVVRILERAKAAGLSRMAIATDAGQ